MEWSGRTWGIFSINHGDFELLYDELKANGIFDELYYELNKSILLIELSEREDLTQVKRKACALFPEFLPGPNPFQSEHHHRHGHQGISPDFEASGRQYSLIVLNGHDADNQPVYSSILILPEYKSVAQYVDLDTLYERLLKVMRGKNIPHPEMTLLAALQPHDRIGPSPGVLASG